jgi:hypothetical protein
LAARFEAEGLEQVRDLGGDVAVAFEQPENRLPERVRV